MTTFRQRLASLSGVELTPSAAPDWPPSQAGLPCVCRSKDISADMWLDELNDAIKAATGLDQLGLIQAPLDEDDLTQAELLEQQRLLADAARSQSQPL